MSKHNTLTGFDDIDQVLRWFRGQTRTLFGAEFVGLYVYGSLALGGFDYATSDLDVLVVTEREPDADQIAALRAIHGRFAEHGSPWSDRIEVVYADRAALGRFPPDHRAYPQVEKERGFFVEPLEVGWIVQCWVLREQGIIVVGPSPAMLIPPLDPDAMRRSAAPVALMWQRDASDDPTWRDWLRERPNMAFVVLTLCRLLYTLDTAEVASKPAAARWAQSRLDERWSPLIARALAGKHTPGKIDAYEEQETLALIDEAVARFRERLPSIGP